MATTVAGVLAVRGDPGLVTAMNAVHPGDCVLRREARFDQSELGQLR